MLEQYWRQAFGWKWRSERPSFEDHFTSLDLAANTGHNLGPNHDPAILRAIRRLSIHRTFEVLQPTRRDEALANLLLSLFRFSRENTLISVNWDTAVEVHLLTANRSWDYGVPMSQITQGVADRASTSLRFLKLHGSRNWFYCDICRRIFFSAQPATHTVDRAGTLLATRDFERLGASRTELGDLRQWKEERQLSCDSCSAELSARVATFSYSKAFGFFQFDAVWEQALRALRSSTRWVFIGYSLPEADFEFRHLLKTAELASGRSNAPTIEVVLGGERADEGALRFRRFFGARLGDVYVHGLRNWVSTYLPNAPA